MVDVLPQFIMEFKELIEVHKERNNRPTVVLCFVQIGLRPTPQNYLYAKKCHATRDYAMLTFRYVLTPQCQKE